AYLKWFAPTPTAPGETAAVESKEGQNAPSNAAVPKGIFGVVPKEVDSLTLRNNKLEVALSNVGGKVSRVSLLDYHRTIRPDSDYITPISPDVSALSLASVFSNPDLTPLAGATYAM